jgi:tRNA(fMet)-specific endonuclease VapC
MNFLLDTDICSAHMRRPAILAHRFVQYTSQLAISSVTLAELYAGAYRHSQTSRLLTLVADLRQEVEILDFDALCAEKFGQVRGGAVAAGHIRAHDRPDDRRRRFEARPDPRDPQHGRFSADSGTATG